MSKVISAEQLTECQRWTVPDVGNVATGVSPTLQVGPLTAEQLESLHKQAYDEGFALGREDGLRAGQAQVRERAQQFARLMATLSRPLDVLDQQVERELVALAIAVARQLVRRELRTDPGQVVASVREALASLPVAARNVRVHLHPEDAKLVRDALSFDDAERTWTIVEDVTLSRGGCKVLSETSQVDAGVEARLATVIARLLGGERAGDEEPPTVPLHE